MRTGVALAACGLALLHTVAARAADDAVCTGEPFAEGQVKSVIDGRTLSLADGREVRLAGIEAPDQGKAALNALVAGQDVALLRRKFGADGAVGARTGPGFGPYRGFFLRCRFIGHGTGGPGRPVLASGRTRII